MKLNNEISGEMAESIQSLYHRIGLLKYTLEGLHSKKWHLIAKSVRELTQFQVKEQYNKVVKLISHPHSQVRKEVQLFIVNLFHFKGLDYLDSLETSLSEWDQIQLLEILQRVDNQQGMDISNWLKSKNETVTLFALKLAKIYNLFEAKEHITELLNHSSEIIRVSAINSLSQLYASDVKEQLKIGYKNKIYDEQIAILNLIENVYDNLDEPFLLELINYKNFEIRIKALNILKLLNVEKLGSLKAQSNDPNYIEAINFATKN